MNNRSQKSINGFVLNRRNSSAEVGTRPSIDKLPVPDRFVNQGNAAIEKRPQENSLIGQAGPRAADKISRSDIDASLDSIDTNPPKARKPKRKIPYKKIAAALMVVVLLMGGYVGYKFLMAGTAVFQGNIFDVFSNRELKSDQYGRTNILVFGTSEDDPAHVEEGLGAALTDSIMVVSIDQQAKNAVMFSVPRVLWIG